MSEANDSNELLGVYAILTQRIGDYDPSHDKYKQHKTNDAMVSYGLRGHGNYRNEGVHPTSDSKPKNDKYEAQQ